MSKPVKIETASTDLSELISNALEARDMSIKDLAEHLQITYEHSRRIVRGESVPSRLLLKTLAEPLKLDFEHLVKLATAARIKAKYGSIPAELAGKKPGMESIERAWDKLTPDQQQDLCDMARTWAKRNATLGGKSTLSGKSP
jgi:transcriptional regulator with XRE-family HTH domain